MVNPRTLLFLLYINDLDLTCDKLMEVLFADDTNLFITGKNLYQITDIMNTESMVTGEYKC